MDSVLLRFSGSDGHLDEMASKRSSAALRKPPEEMQQAIEET